MARLRVPGFTISVDEMHVAIAPIVISGERLFDDPADSAGLTVVDHVATPSATHVLMRRS